MLAMVLARIRQLSAHEVGHTLGIEHDFAASKEARASVMDYPFPLIRLTDDGDIRQQAADADLPGFAELVDTMLEATWYANRRDGMQGFIHRRTNRQTLHALMRLAADEGIDPAVRMLATGAIDELDEWLEDGLDAPLDARWRAAWTAARQDIERFDDDPAYVDQLAEISEPPGSLIGDGTG